MTILRSSRHSWLLIWLACISLSSGQGAPVTIPWADRTFGPDGPWYAVELNVGSSDALHMYFAGRGESIVIDSVYCNNQTWASDCLPEEYSSLYDPDASQDAIQNTLPKFGPMEYFREPGNPIYDGHTAGFIFDTISFAGFDWSVDNCTLDPLITGYYQLPDGTPYPLTLGTLSYGSEEDTQDFNTAVNGSVPLNNLAVQGIIPSRSFGIHIGSAAAGISPSLIWGGYDQNRVIGPVATLNIDINNRETATNLLDIGIGTAEGDSPFKFSTKAGLLRQGNSSIGSSVLTQLSNKTPYMFLPQSTCDAIASYLPVTFNPDLGLYLWNTDDAAYFNVMSSASYLAFAFETSDQPITIKAPWKLFDLTLDPTLVSSSQQYFPCRPYSGFDSRTSYYVLGRAFLQAAFYGIYWNSPSQPGTWFLAQAPGPGVSSTSSVVSLQGGDKITAGATDWAESWRDTWNGGGGGSGLGTGAQAGIGVAAALAALLILAILFFFFGIKRYRKKQEERRKAKAAAAQQLQKKRAEAIAEKKSQKVQSVAQSGVSSPPGEPETRSPGEDDPQSPVTASTPAGERLATPLESSPVMHEMADTSPSSPYRWHSLKLKSKKLDSPIAESSRE